MPKLIVFSSFKNLKLRSKTLGLVAILLAILGVNAGVTLWKLDLIGAEIAELAEIDLPLTRGVTEASVLQLEQAILFERAGRLGEAMAVGHADSERFAAVVERFNAINGKVEEEMLEAAAFAETAIGQAHGDYQRAEYKRVAEQLKNIVAAHESYAEHAAEVFVLFDTGEILRAEKATEQVESEQDTLTHEIEALLFELESFTQAAATKAETDEKRAVVLLAGISLAGMVLGLGLGWVISSAMSKPLSRAVATVKALAEGDTSVELKADSEDEVGELAKTIEVFRQTTIEAKALAERQKVEEAREKQRLERQAELTRNFDNKIQVVLETVAAAATEMQSTAGSLTATAEQTSEQSGSVASASQEASTNVQTVAAAAEELSNAIAEISNQVAQSTAVAQGAVNQADAANEEMQGLDEAGQRIGEIMSLISDIAEQTNLLALNATIEAARAGEAGKGFAVVANEVKSLANQTAKATEEISRQIGEMQAATGGAVGKIKEISSTITTISEIATDIASAVEEQTAATQEIARNVEQAAAGTAAVDKNISGVSAAAEETGSSAKDVLEAAGELARQSETMKSEVQGFLDGIRQLDEVEAA
ncbi:methyl-accepting chemotaxis protein [Pelagibius sp.]|uniref:methyl-accepting chemotaxis protein n=1 Tax=Pelagibius sp. TaxID=1931238 RepID=UPI003BAFCDBC